MNAKLTQSVRAKLNDIFIHAIDPTFANRDELSRIHSGIGDTREEEGPVLGRSRGGLQAMC